MTLKNLGLKSLFTDTALTICEDTAAEIFSPVQLDECKRIELRKLHWMRNYSYQVFLNNQPKKSKPSHSYFLLSIRRQLFF